MRIATFQLAILPLRHEEHKEKTSFLEEGKAGWYFTIILDYVIIEYGIRFKALVEVLRVLCGKKSGKVLKKGSC